MKISVLTIICLLTVLICMPAQSMTLATNGKAKATIVLGLDASKPGTFWN